MSDTNPTETSPGIRGKLLGCTLVASLIATIYLGWAYAGPYRWLAELQLKGQGSYDVNLTGFFTFLFLAVPPMAMIIIGSWVLRSAAPEVPDQWPDSLHDDAHWNTTATSTTQAPEVATQSPSRFGNFNFGILAMAMFLWIFGGVLWYDYATSQNMTDISIEDWEAGRDTGSRWVTLHGRVLADAAMSYGDRSRPDVFVPVVSKHWRPGKPVKVFLKVFHNEAKSGRWAATDTHQGTVGFLGLPGPVRVAFEQGPLVPDADCVVITTGLNAERNRYGAIAAITVGCLIMAGYCVFAALHSTAGPPSASQIAPLHEELV